MTIHPAMQIGFDSLVYGMEEMVSAKYVNRQTDGHLAIYSYSDSCTYDRMWNEYTLVARGLILDMADKRIAALPFPKFFNVGEHQGSIPDLPFETFEKMDGSLIVLFYHAGRWRCATRGSFKSEQAMWAQSVADKADLSPLDTGTTYLLEAIYQANRIVVRYDVEGLFFLGAYTSAGHELSYDELVSAAASVGWGIAKRHEYSSVSYLLSLSKVLTSNEEGFVIRFQNGLRLKIKGEEYLRIHRMVSRLTPLSVWESMMAGDDLEAIRRELPEEFWGDFDTIRQILGAHIQGVVSRTAKVAETFSGASDKEVGLSLATIPEDVRSFVFPYRKQNGELLFGRSRTALFRHIRPTGNRLDGYTPSCLLNRVFDEAA